MDFCGLAKHLGGVVETDMNSPSSLWTVISIPNQVLGNPVRLYISPNRTHERLTISGLWPAGHNGHVYKSSYTAMSPEITVSAETSILKVANRIKSSFLPKWLPMLSQAYAIAKSYEEHALTQAETLSKVLQAMEITPNRQRLLHDEYRPCTYFGSRSLSATVTGDTVSLELHNLTSSEAIEVINTIKARFKQ